MFSSTKIAIVFLIHACFYINLFLGFAGGKKSFV